MDQPWRHAPQRADGKIESVVTSLEMLARPGDPARAAPRGDLVIMRSARPTVAFYRISQRSTLEPPMLSNESGLPIAAATSQRSVAHNCPLSGGSSARDRVEAEGFWSPRRFRPVAGSAPLPIDTFGAFG